MTPKSKPKAYLSPIAFADFKRLPGNVRRQIIEAIDGLEKDLRPSNSKKLTIEGETSEIRRLRLDKWRVIYLIRDDHPIILGIRRRPPYDYDDIQSLIMQVE
jgi:mRNA-degrading endonuclease RelE of RelBE toxin-antitoxin system